jgi:DNA/RNA-binding domain of Phe-tRNA-synthetase-like protein
VEPDLEQGWVDSELAQEFPDLALWLTRVEAGSGRTPMPVRRRLGQLSNRITGGHVIHMRQDPVPWAYRVFWRQVGLDPDTDRTPVEQIALDRLQWGGLRSQNLLDDALTIATLETGVPVVAFDAEKVGRAIGLRLAAAGEALGGSGRPLSPGQIVLADEDRPLAVLSGEVAEERGVTRSTRRTVLGSVQVKGVPAIAVEEALWTVADMLAAGDDAAEGHW